MKLNLKFVEKHKFVLLVILVSIIYMFIQVNVISEFKQLPSPIYGGDYYYQLGSVYHVSESSPSKWFKGSNVVDSLPNNMPVYGIYVSLFVWILNLTPMIAMLVSSIFLIPLVFLIIFFVLKKLFDDEWIAFIGTLIFLPINKFPIIKYTNFTVLVFAPLFVLVLYNFFKNINLKNAILLGLCGALFSLSHPVGFIASNLLLLLFSFKFFILDFISFKDKKINKKNLWTFWKKNFYLLVIVFVILFLISLIYWYEPIFVHHGKTLNDDQDWTNGDFGKLSFGLRYAYDTLKNVFFNFSNIFLIATSLMAIIGLSIFFVNKKQMTFNYTFIKYFFIFSLIIVLHYFVTEPIIGTNLVPGHMSVFVLSFGTLFITLFGIKFLSVKLNKYKLALYILLIVLFVVGDVIAFQQYQNDKWTQVGKNPLSPNLASLQTWLTSNTQISDVILSSNEVSFAINALSGRKTVIFRRAHNDKFMNFDIRETDGAVIFYGNNTLEKLKLLKKYDVKYLYWDYYWINSEYYFDKDGKMTGWFDPLVIRTTNASYEQKLIDNGVKYIHQTTWLDPSVKGPDIMQMDLLFVTPNNYRSFESPWGADLDQFLDEVWNYTDSGRKIAVMYSFNQEKIDAYISNFN